LSEARRREELLRATIAAIPRGRVASYGRIAERAGLPGRARLVGRVLRQAPDELKLPWHRVLRADGRSAFASGTPNFRKQVDHLAAEGVPMIRGRVDLRRYGWGATDDLDHSLWGPPPS